MPTAPKGPWLDVALARGLIAKEMVRSRVRAPAPGCSEREFQARLLELAEGHGWRAYHTHDSRRSAAGFPDLAFVRGPVLIFAELKTDAGRLSPEQAEWLELLRAVEGVRVRLWRPSDWPAIVAELEGGDA